MGKIRKGITVVGITGAIGAGKSTALALFKELGAFPISSDAIARSFSDSNSPILPELKEILGDSILDSSGNVDRAKIAEIIFQDQAKLKALEALIHPKVRQKFLDQIEALPNQTVVAWEVPLLFETDAHTICDHTICIGLEEDASWKRVESRGGMTEADFRNRWKAQMPISEKARRASFALWNIGTKQDLKEKLESFLSEKKIFIKGIV